MSSPITMYTRYHSGNDFGGVLQVNKFLVQKRGTPYPDDISIEFEGDQGSVSKAWMIVEPKLAIALARCLLSVAEGYASETKSDIS